VVVVCTECLTAKDRANAVGREVLADLLLPFLIYGICLGTLILCGAVQIH
jgi:hypothetical protein